MSFSGKGLKRLFNKFQSARHRPSAEPITAPPPVPPQASQQSNILKSKWLELPYSDIEHHGRMMRFATTGAWIDSFAEGETLFDIGANVGMYTIYAAVMRGAKVFAFEPEALNYAELNKNIFLNGLHDRVLAYCLALSDVDKTDRLLLSDFGLGISYHDFEENSWTEDKEFAPDWKVSKDNRRPQGCVGRTLDSLIADGLPIPQHIKIDVDGLEHRVVAGMLGALASPALKTVLIEINFDNPKNLEIIETMESLGWKYSWDQLRINRTVKFTVEKIQSYQRRGIGGLNYIFFKDDKYSEMFSKLFESYTPGNPLVLAGN
jgi:FkbM family methyltransferase